MNYDNLDFRTYISDLAAQRELPVTDVKITFNYEDGCDCIVTLSIKIWGEEEKDKFHFSDFTIRDMAEELFDRYFNVTEGLYEDIAACHLEGVSVYKRNRNGVLISVLFEGSNTWMSTSRTAKPYGSPVTEIITNNFDVYKYFEVRERVRDEREEAEISWNNHLDHLRKTA